MNSTQSISLHQQLINEACNYKNKYNLSYDQMIKDLDKRHKAAILFKDLNYQVGNGGFYQWFENKYGTDKRIDLLLGYLEEIETYSSSEVADILVDSQQLKASVYPELDHENDYYIYEEVDREYYRFNTQLLLDIEAWLLTIPTI